MTTNEIKAYIIQYAFYSRLNVKGFVTTDLAIQNSIRMKVIEDKLIHYGYNKSRIEELCNDFKNKKPLDIKPNLYCK